MSLNVAMKKLQKAILSKGLIIKIGTVQFYSHEQNRLVTVWILSTPTWQSGKNGWRTMDYEILRTASVVEAVKCLAEIWERLKEWENDKAGSV